MANDNDHSSNSSSDKTGQPEPTPSRDTMRAWTYTSAGNDLAAALKLSDAARGPAPPTAPGRLVVRVTHTSLNPADYKIPEMGRVVSAVLTGSLGARTPGLDYAGVVVETPGNEDGDGDGETAPPGYAIGDAVFGNVGPRAAGTLAERIEVTAGTPTCVPLPPSVSGADASTLGTAAQTAYQALRPHVRPGMGDEVFVNGGSGGVGTYAIQIAARVLGAVVTATASGASGGAALCAALGATTVLDYATTDVVAALRARGPVFRLVVDNVGHSPPGLYAAADDFLSPDGGAYVQIGGELGLDGIRALASRALPLPRFLGGGGSRPWKFIVTDNNYDDLAQLARWMQEGKIRAVIDGDVYPFEDAPKAFEKLKTGRTKGKLVVRVTE